MEKTKRFEPVVVVEARSAKASLGYNSFDVAVGEEDENVVVESVGAVAVAVVAGVGEDGLAGVVGAIAAR